MPQRRGPRWRVRRTCGHIEQQVLILRRNGANRYEIYEILKPKLKHLTPSPSTIYRIIKRHRLNRLKRSYRSSF